jgi:CHASE3 domain sensor protein
MHAIKRTAAACAAIAAIGSGLIAYTLRHADTTGALVIRSHRALATTEEILRRALDAEWEARGYAISRNRAYLAPFDRAARMVQTRIDELQWLVVDASEHQDVERLRVEINGLFNTLRPMVRRTVTADDVDTGLSDEAEPRIETIRRLVREIRQVETERLAARVAADESATRAVRVLATVMTGIGTVLAAAALIFTVWLVRPGWGRSAT